ncbi:MerR family transcriptional regulator [Tropicimonas sp. IMCC6043]|uniref:MerR family transcriptional regulator n=1 Tax=Tropicimonas sp. IMCC6043 TaxID=2510645 RepID=UPI00101DF6D1|nr:MerR family transcriptional regulator [Tropicimonas sp. IMCC6043]RYH12123.1 MerR family transcriptional regulator [Tropicimonas sp. IMCC6043]
MAEKSPDAFRTISEVAEWLGVNAHVLRFWESKFTQVKPIKRAGGRRYYRRSDMELLGGIQKLLHEDGMTIKGVQKVLRDQGIRAVAAMSKPVEEIVGPDPAEVSDAPAPALTPEPAESVTEAVPAPESAAPAPERPQAPVFARHADEPDSPDSSAAAPPPPATDEPAEEVPHRGPSSAGGPIIAPLPGPKLTLAEALSRLSPRQIPAADLAPIHARLLALRERMGAGA